jgi:peroxiredoxin
MGTQPVLRRSRLTLALAATLLAGVPGIGVPAIGVPAAAAQSVPAVQDAGAGRPEAVVLVDLRRNEPGGPTALHQSRQLLRAKLAAAKRLVVVPKDADSALARAFAGEPVTNTDELQRTARAALEKAAAAYGNHDCRAAAQAAQRGIAALAALQAGSNQAGADRSGAPTGLDRKNLREDLRRAYVYELLCAHQQGSSDAALTAAQRLERLGVTSPPPGVSSLIWGLYPAVDVTTNVMMNELTITTEPAGGEVWVDHLPAGFAPVTVLMSEGRHLVAAAHPRAGGVAREVTVAASDTNFVMAVPASSASGQASQVAEAVSDWRRRSVIAADKLGAVMGELSTRFALVMVADDLVELWALGPGETEARRVSVHSLDQAGNLVADILARARRWDHTGPEPDGVLLRESMDSQAGAKAATPRSQRWWVYATIVGAVALAGGVMLTSDLVDDRQRIEIVWP